jgi:hypothetical protein
MLGRIVMPRRCARTEDVLRPIDESVEQAGDSGEHGSGTEHDHAEQASTSTLAEPADEAGRDPGNGQGAWINQNQWAPMMLCNSRWSRPALARGVPPRRSAAGTRRR